MELKFLFVTTVTDIILFQSYLYGIEINKTEGMKLQPFGFNRTFMELKFRRTVQGWLRVLFQSYLYGIEIAVVRLHRREHISVSIVPLWNWNRALSFQPGWYSLFQSYLYGSEIHISLSRVVYLPVSIVPLWNWNQKYAECAEIED